MNLEKYLPQRAALAIRAVRAHKKSFGRYPNILAPKTFSEKIQHRKIFDRDIRFPLWADKIAVKRHVAETLGANYVIPTLWQGSQLPAMKERVWPTPFVIKANNGSGWNVFVHNDSELIWRSIEQKMQRWVGKDYGAEIGEWLYGEIEQRFFVEPFIGDDLTSPPDFKLWTFDGRVEFIQVDSDRHTDHKRTMFDREWSRLPFTIEHDTNNSEITAPHSLREMIQAAETLVQDIPFVRVDFYEMNKVPVFGEMTFYPGSGLEHFDPPEYDAKIGALWLTI